MEMNFPHKGPKADADLDRSAEDQQQSDYTALMANVIARQSLSHSARKVFAHEMALASAIASNEGRSLHNRIRFFAGLSGDETETESNNLFVRGHFRPDLAEKSIVGASAWRKV
ncbi:MAG: hypothetical protein Pars2KO_13310 [Parasphingorhabdus sp.]